MLRSYYDQREGFDRGVHGTQGQTGLRREYVGKDNKNGLNIQDPGREDGSQKSKRIRSEGTTVELDNLAGGLLDSGEGRRLVEVRTPR